MLNALSCVNSILGSLVGAVNADNYLTSQEFLTVFANFISSILMGLFSVLTFGIFG